MRSNTINGTKIITAFFTLCLANTAFAQQATTATTPATSADNTISVLMVVIALLLAFVIWGMGQVLVTISRQAFERSRKPNGIFSAILLAGLCSITYSSNAQDNTNLEIVKTIPIYGSMDSTEFWMLAAVIFIEFVVIGFMMFSIRRVQMELMPEEKAGQMTFRKWWSALDKRLFTKAVSVEKEADILLDHDYDGIKELDNSLPPWWKYGFIFTIIVAFVYMLNFHVWGYGKNPTEEYQAEMLQAQEENKIYEAKNADKIDETNLKMPEAAGIDNGKEIFNSMCWTCHGKLGEGGAGPNLTDEYWLHKGSLTDIYLSIKHGYPDKGMQAWEKNYSPKEINNLAGFIKTLKGTNPPNPKAPQGDIYSENNTADSSAVKTPAEKTASTTL